MEFKVLIPLAHARSFESKGLETWRRQTSDV